LEIINECDLKKNNVEAQSKIENED
jgi:nucleolar MIF4G domain-containing protein 1